MKKIVFLTFGYLLSTSIFTNASAQQMLYRSAAGVRLGPQYGITYKQFIHPWDAIEGIASFYGGFAITGLYEKHVRHPFSVDEMNFYYGAGAHIATFSKPTFFYNDNKTKTVVGIDGILGLEYTFKDYPINLSLDFKPVMNLTYAFGIWADGAVSVRYVIK